VFSTADTITAIATPPGRGGIGVVRIAGPDAEAIARRLLGRTRPLEPRHATLATVTASSFTPNGRARPIDQVIATWFRAPHSYTGDDVVEIAAHGSPPVLRQIVARAMEEGARLAEPGEFTLRAYLNGRLDLAQAEAVADLIEAVTPLQARAAMDQLDGTLTGRIGLIDARLFDLIARLEASLDFPEEGFHFVTAPDVVRDLTTIAADLDDLARDGQRGRVIREGVTVALAGRPNVGKSSLFNRLVGADRAIVTAAPGTTRDVLAADADVDGVRVTFVDAAGLREAADEIEAEGVRRAKAVHDVAQLVLVVLDRSEPLTAEDRALLVDAGDRRGGPRAARLVVVNKSDRPAAWRADRLQNAASTVIVSAKTGEGIDELRGRIVQELTGREPVSDVPAITNARHLGLVDTARVAVGRAVSAIRDGATEEMVVAELVLAREALEAIAGRRAPDDLLHHVFARFCVGK
jgi:tRNA modification GTPase